MLSHSRSPLRNWSLLLVVLPLLAAAAYAAPVTWPFDFFTTGQPVFWTSPSALDPTADWYIVSWDITLVQVTLKPPIFPEFTVDVTDQVPPEYRIGTQTALGPAPIIAVQQSVVYPPPPDPVAFAADIEIGLNTAGYGYVNMTNVQLGSYVYQGITMQVRKVRWAGTVTAEAFHGSTLLGDLNCDSVVNFDDINALVLALGGFDGYHAAYPACNWLNADCNQDGLVDFDDIDAFVAILTGL